MRNRLHYIHTFIILSMILSNLIFIGSPSKTLAAAPGEPKPEMTKLTVGLPVPSISFLPVWVADQNGFLRRKGLQRVEFWLSGEMQTLYRL